MTKFSEEKNKIVLLIRSLLVYDNDFLDFFFFFSFQWAKTTRIGHMRFFKIYERQDDELHYLLGKCKVKPQYYVL